MEGIDAFRAAVTRRVIAVYKIEPETLGNKYKRFVRHSPLRLWESAERGKALLDQPELLGIATEIDRRPLSVHGGIC